MKRESIVPVDRDAWLTLRAKDLTSTETPALFGLSPYMTRFELWHRKHDQTIGGISENERMTWGQRLQDAIAFGVAGDNSLTIRPMPEYIHLPELRLGSSFDYRILTGAAGDSENDGIFEVKNVDSLAYKEGWLETETGIEAPPHIEIQVQHQLLVSGLRFAKIGALVGGNRGVIIPRAPDGGIREAILDKASEFWQSIDRNEPPVPDFQKDADFIAKLQAFAEPNKVVDMTDNEEVRVLAFQYKMYSDAATESEKNRKAIKAKLLLKIGDAEKTLGDGFSISAGMIGPARVEAYDKGPYRSFRVNWNKSGSELTRSKGHAPVE